MFLILCCSSLGIFRSVDLRGPEANKDSHDGLGVFGEEVLRAARSLASLEWRVIREERFNVTPVGDRQPSTIVCYFVHAVCGAYAACPRVLTRTTDSEPSWYRSDRYVRRDRQECGVCLEALSGRRNEATGLARIGRGRTTRRSRDWR